MKKVAASAETHTHSPAEAREAIWTAMRLGDLTGS
jgi:hypothetical protein